MIQEELQEVEQMMRDKNPLYMEKFDQIISKYTSESDVAAINEFARRMMVEAKMTIDKIEKEMHLNLSTES